MFKNTLKHTARWTGQGSAHDKKINKSNYTCSMYIFETSIHRKIVSRYSPCNANKNHLHFKNCVKSTRSLTENFLKPERLANLTEVGKLFHTRTILLAKNRLRVLRHRMMLFRSVSARNRSTAKKFSWQPVARLSIFTPALRLRITYMLL